MEGYLSIREVAEMWNLSPRRVQKMCADGLIPGVIHFGKAWAIPVDAEKPADGRITTGKYRDWRKKDSDS